MAYNSGRGVSGYRNSMKMSPNMYTRRRPNAKFFTIMGVAAAVIVAALILILQGSPTVAVQQGSYDYKADFDMLILRDEVVYKAKNYGRADFIATEGSHVESGAPIVKVYQLGYNEETVTELLDLEKTILDYEVNVRRAGVIDPTLDDTNKKISDKAKEIQLAITGGTPEKLLGLERDMETLLNNRMAYLSGVVTSDDQLRKYLSKEDELNKTIDAWCNVVKSGTGGTVSFYFDGCESLMSKDNIGKFTKGTLQELTQGKTINISDKDKNYTPLYRVVSADDWFVVLLSDKAIPEMFLGNTYSIVFDDYLDKKYTGTVYNQQKLEKNDGYVYTIQIKGDIGPMIGDRRVSAKMSSMIQGFRIPKSLIKPQNGVDYVQTTGGQAIPVLVVAEDGNYVIIQTYKGQPTLEAGELLKK